MAVPRALWKRGDLGWKLMHSQELHSLPRPSPEQVEAFCSTVMTVAGRN